jgi:hypothetical protein
METNKPALTLYDGKAAHAIKTGQANAFVAHAGDHYRVMRDVNGKQQLADDVIAKRTGNDLVLNYADGTQVSLQGYYLECNTTASCEISLPAKDDATYAVSDKADGLALGDGTTLVYAHGSQDALLGMVQGNAPLTTAIASGEYGHAVSSHLSMTTVGALAFAGAGLGAVGHAVQSGGSTPPSYPPDTKGPTVYGITLNNSSLPSAAFKAGDTITVQVSLSEGVLITGNPQVALDIGGTIVYANLTPGSTGSNQTFTYKILAGQVDPNGIAIPANALVLNGATITDISGNAAIITSAGMPDNPGYMVDTVAPKINSIAITSSSGAPSGIVKAGDTVSVTVSMSEATTVTGTPQLALNVGGATAQATYASGSGSDKLVFTYTVKAGQTDANGISIGANALTLNGGTLRDATGNNAVITSNSVTDNPAYVVQVEAPSPVGVNANEAANVTGVVHQAIALGSTTIQDDHASASIATAPVAADAPSSAQNVGSVTQASAHARTLSASALPNLADTVDAASQGSPSVTLHDNAVTLAADTPAADTTHGAALTAPAGSVGNTDHNPPISEASGIGPFTLDGAGIHVDLSQLVGQGPVGGSGMAHVAPIERIDLNGDANSLTLTVADLIDGAGTQLVNIANGWAAGAPAGTSGAQARHQPALDGGADNSLTIVAKEGTDNGAWVDAGTLTANHHTYEVYHMNGTNAELLINTALTRSFAG